METVIVVLIVCVAVGYLGYTFYRQLSGKCNCSSGSSCSTEVKHQCHTNAESLNNLTLKKE